MCVKALVRWVLWIVDGFPYFLPLVGFIVGLTTVGHRRVGDMAAKTFVVRRAAMGSPIVVPGLTAPPAPAGYAGAWGAPPPDPTGATTGWGPAVDPSSAGWASPTPPPAAAPTAPDPGVPQWDEARGTYIQWDPDARRVDAVERGHQDLVPHRGPVAPTSAVDRSAASEIAADVGQPRSRMAIERRRRSRWCSRDRVARCSTSVVASDGGSLSA